MRATAWDRGQWTNRPADQRVSGSDLVVRARGGSDAWRHTSYGFIHDSEHALVAPWGPEHATEVVFTAALRHQFDQAGVFVRAGPTRWVKAGVELVDGVTQVGAVVTDEWSDWSMAPASELLGQRVRVRVSWSSRSLTIRAGLDGQDLSLVRVAPFAPSGPVAAGPFTCAPTAESLEVTFHEWSVGPADQSLHEE